MLASKRVVGALAVSVAINVVLIGFASYHLGIGTFAFDGHDRDGAAKSELDAALAVRDSQHTQALAAAVALARSEGREAGFAEGVAEAESLVPEPATADVRNQARLNPATLLIPRIISKRENIRNPSDSIWLDVAWDTTGLPKPTSAIKGSLVFTDLFDDEKLRLEWTIHTALQPGQEFVEKSVGITTDQTMDQHSWLAFEKLSRLKVRFEASSVIFADGTKSEFGRERAEAARMSRS